MSFLSPALFAALIPLVALPLVLHLLNKGFPRHFKFPSIELIKETMAQRSRLHRWRHWILLLLRTAFLVLLLLAFLQPVWRRFGSNPAAEGARQVLIVLDHSVSMEHRGDGAASRERAVHEAEKLIGSLAPRDGVNVLLMDPAPSACFPDFSTDQAEALRFLGRLKPGLGRADVNLANAAAARLLAQSAARPEVYYISDFQRKNWANTDFTALPPESRLFFVDVGPANRDNRAILDAQLSQARLLAGDTVTLEVTVGNFSGSEFDSRVTVTLDRQFSFDQEVSLGPWSDGKVTVPVPVGGPGVHLCEVSLPADALEADNHFCFTLSVLAKEEVLIVTDGPDNQTSGAYFLKTALNPFEDEGGSLLPHVIASRELNASRLAGVRKVFLTQLNRLGDEECALLARHLFQGGGLVYFLDGAEDANNLAALEKALSPDTLPLHLTQRRTATNVVSGAQQVVRGDFRSPYLRMFQGSLRQNLGLLEFYDYYQASATGAGAVLLTYADESPAMASLHHGLGTALLLNFSASEFSSNLARQRIFPAWMQELVKALSADELPPSAYTLGETLHTEVWRSELRDADFITPDGRVQTVKREPEGERYHVTFTPDQLGFYTLGAPRPLYAFGVNTSPEEADLRPLDKEALPTQFAAGRPASFVAGAEDFDALANGIPVFHWFVLAAVAFLLLETGFQLLLRRKAA